LPNVWLGVSVENQHFADERIPLLLQTPAAVRFISAEPLLERIDVRPYLPSEGYNTLPGLDWVIVGGESGHGARPFDVAWARSIVKQCQAAGVPVFVKQLGSNPFDSARQSCPPDECMIHGYSWLTLKARKAATRPSGPKTCAFVNSQWRRLVRRYALGPFKRCAERRRQAVSGQRQRVPVVGVAGSCTARRT
jgi:hypothetical protein